MNDTQNTLALSNAKTLFCSILIFFGFFISIPGVILSLLAFVIVTPCISVLLLAKKHFFLATSLGASFIAIAFLCAGNTLYGFSMFFITVLLGVVLYFGIKNGLTKVPLIAILCVLVIFFAVAALGLFVIDSGISFSDLYKAFNDAINSYSEYLYETLSVASGDLYSKSDIQQIIKSFTTSAKLYFVPACIAYLEVVFYLALLVIAGITRQKTDVVPSEVLNELKDMQRNIVIITPKKYVYPVDIPLKLSKISGAVFAICYLCNMFASGSQSPIAAALGCVYMILLPFFVASGIKYVNLLFMLKGSKNANVWTSLVCIFLVLFLQSAGLSMLGFFGFWYVILPKSTKNIINR